MAAGAPPITITNTNTSIYNPVKIRKQILWQRVLLHFELAFSQARVTSIKSQQHYVSESVDTRVDNDRTWV